MYQLKTCFSILLFTYCITFSLTSYEYNLSICAIFKNNAPYLKEWIEYHRMLGVDHFYLYDNASTDHPENVLKEYIKNDIVTLIYWKNKKRKEWKDRVFAWVYTTQLPAYHHAARLSYRKTKWLAFLDTDEFIVPIDYESITDLLKAHKEYPGISLYWEVYGTSNIYDIPSGYLMIELLTKKCHPSHPINLATKTIVKPKQFIECINPHIMRFKNNQSAYQAPRTEARINHYINRTVKFFYEHKIKSKPFMDNVKWDAQSARNFLEMGNDVEDTIMERFIPKLKQRMQF